VNHLVHLTETAAKSSLIMKSIKSTVIGTLAQNSDFEDWWESDLIEIPFFNNLKLKVVFMGLLPEEDEQFIPEADNALNLFISKTDTDRLAISHLVYKNCMDFLNAVGYDEYDKVLWEIKDKNDIWNHVQPFEIYISRRPYNDKDIYININCDCDWELEHGLQLVFRQGKQITRVSMIDGHLTEADAYDKPDSEDERLQKVHWI
jgi:hypothetical protein